MPTGAHTQRPWMPHAWADLGQREIAGPASNPRIADYIRRVGQPALARDDTAWCAAFVGACLDRAGVRGTGSLMARSYLKWGRTAEPGTLGAIAVLTRGSDPAFGHVGFLVGEAEGDIFLLGGNQSDAVTVARFDRARLIGLRLPASEALPPEDAASTGEPPSRPSASGARSGAPEFTWSLARILAFEGGYTDDPFDPGGPTNKGITLADYARAQGETVTYETVGRLKAELRAIPDALVRRIYRDRYWRPALCPDLAPPLAHFHFDAAVNQGVAGAARMLQEALGVEADGEIGPLTLAAAEERPLLETLERYAAIRRRRYRALQHFWRFGRGWLARVDKALAQARELAGRAAVHAPSHVESAPEPAPPTTEREADMPNHRMPTPIHSAEPVTDEPSPGKWWGESLTIWGALLTAATTVAPALFAAFGLDVSADLAQRLGRDVITVVQAIGGLAGTLMTIAGRARATGPLERRALAVRL